MPWKFVGQKIGLPLAISAHPRKIHITNAFVKSEASLEVQYTQHSLCRIKIKFIWNNSNYLIVLMLQFNLKLNNTHTIMLAVLARVSVQDKSEICSKRYFVNSAKRIQAQDKFTNQHSMTTKFCESHFSYTTKPLETCKNEYGILQTFFIIRNRYCRDINKRCKICLIKWDISWPNTAFFGHHCFSWWQILGHAFTTQ